MRKVQENKVEIQRAITSLLERLLEELKAYFEDELVSVILFGSFARGDFTRDSDIDLLIVVEDLPRSFLQRDRLFIEIERRIKGGFGFLREKGYMCQFMPILKTKEEAAYHSPLYLDIVEDGKVLYDKDNFFSKVAGEIRQRLSELGARRNYLKGGGWYWDLKPDYRYGDKIEI